MAKTPIPDNDSPPDAETELLGHLDDSITGALHGTGGDTPGPADPARVRPEQVDLLLKLHQLGAAWRETTAAVHTTQPARIDRFEIVREVGQGGFASVYEATDTLLRRRVALKVPHPQALVSPDMRRRFLRGAALAARLAHPNLVTIHDLGESDGVAFIAEEFCSGGTLAGWLERHPGPVDPRSAALVVKHLAAGLDVGHEAGIVHRDIKPENILLVPATGVASLPAGESAARGAVGPGFDVKLGDFGLGKADDDSSHDPLAQSTRAGARPGTPAWMAPEQIDRAIGAVGPATDVHALGLLLDRLLSGRCRWAGANDSDTMRLILLREPEAIERGLPGVDRDLVAVCRKCLARNPVDRYSRSGHVAAELSRFLLGVPTLARPLSAWERACRFAIRRPSVVVASAVALAALVACGIALRGWSIQTAAADRQRAWVRRTEAAQHLQRGLDDLRAGNVAVARQRFADLAALDPDLDASFAGRWARRRLHAEQAVLFGDPDSPAPSGGPPRDLYCCALSPDGARIAVGAADGRLILLDAEGAAAPTVVPGAHDEINDVAFSPDGRLVATAGEDGRVRLFSAETGRLDRDVAAEPKALFAVGFAPDGSTLAWGGAERVLTVAAIGAGDARRFPVPMTIAPGTLDPDIEAIQFVDDGTIAVVGGIDTLLLSAADGSIVRRFGGHGGSVGSVDIAPDRTRLVTAGMGQVPRVWRIATGDLIASLPRHREWVQGCVFTADGTRIVSGCRDGVLQVFDAATGELLERLPGHDGRVWDVRREAGGTVVSVGRDGTLRRWATGHAGSFAGARELPVAVDACVAVFPVAGSGGLDQAGIVVAGTPATTIVVDPATGREIVRHGIPAAANMVWSAIDEPRGRVALALRDAPLAVATITGLGSANAAAESRTGIDVIAHRVAWSPGGQLVTVTNRTTSVVRGRDAALAEEVKIDRLDDPCDAVAVAPDGGTIALGGGAVLRVAPIARHGPPRPSGPPRSVFFDQSFGSVYDVAWSPDGTRLAVASKSGNVRIVDARDGSTLQVLAGHRDFIRALGWSADGRVLYSADGESLKITDSVTAVPIDTFSPGWSIHAVALAGPPQDPDRWLVIGGEAALEERSADGPAGRGRLLVVDLGR